MAEGRYGVHGGQFIPEVLMDEINKISESYEYYKNDKQFNEDLENLLNEAAILAAKENRVYIQQKDICHYYI